MDRISCIVLNYNDADTTLGLVEELKSLACLDSVVVVDNCSTDDSWERLKSLERQGRDPGRIPHIDSGRIPDLYLLQTGRNGGYGPGNQAGIDFASQNLGADYVIVANPDIHVTGSCIEQVKAALDGTEGCALASAMVESPDGQELFSYWKLMGIGGDLLDTGLFTRRLFRRWLNDPKEKLKRGGTGGSRLVDAVPGSFFMLRLDRFPPGEIKRIFDKNIFLYYEEKVLGQKLKALGLKAVLATGCSYVHAHSVSLSKSVSKILDRQKLQHRSKLYYYREYLHAGPVKMAVARVFLAVVLGEIWFLTEVCGMRW